MANMNGLGKSRKRAGMTQKKASELSGITQTPEGVWGNSLGRPKLTIPKTSIVIPWPGGFAIAA